jgi:hypothetical protein
MATVTDMRLSSERHRPSVSRPLSVFEHGRYPSGAFEEETVARRTVQATLLGVFVIGLTAAALPGWDLCPFGPVAQASARVTASPSPGSAAGQDETGPYVSALDAMRERFGCRPLVPDDALRRSAQAYSVVLDARGGVSHVDGIGGTALDRARRQGYAGDVVELTAEGRTSADGFGESLTHVADGTDLQDCRFRSVGAGVTDEHVVIVIGDR